MLKGPGHTSPSPEHEKEWILPPAFFLNLMLNITRNQAALQTLNPNLSSFNGASTHFISFSIPPKQTKKTHPNKTPKPKTHVPFSI